MIDAIKTVLAAFFGVRGRKGAESSQKVKPQQIVITAIVLALILALLVFGLVRLLVAEH
ncbi:hypothetical protein HNQ50_002992 [Silvimonas terrae]|uniref:DUF2970 domain-containing protein n=1 Tax=Silvimonas terrae TaxID=300266 RepID=A0A840RJB4_9NEIS|nr:DUF2970 domain-containing protein [Silvimonas terrae]MBB5192251.1 hypothetical protein [Silvimonas terrae]